MPLRRLLCVLLAFAPALACANDDPRIDAILAELAHTRSIEQVALSPDGAHLAWVVQTQGQPVVMLADADGTQAHAVGDPAGHCAQDRIVWSPDSHTLAFLSNCGESVATNHRMHITLYTVGIAPGAVPHRVRELDGYAHALAWRDAGAIDLLFVPGATRRASALDAAKPPSGVIGVDGLEVQRVAQIGVADGALTLLTPASLHVYEFDATRDGERLAYVAAPPPGDDNWWVAKLYVQDARTDAAPRMALDTTTVGGPLHGLQIALPRFSPDGRTLAFIGGLMSDQGATGGDIYTLDADADHGTPRDRTPDATVTPAWLAWTGADTLLVTRVASGHAQVARYTLPADGANARAQTLFTLAASVGDGSAEMALSLSSDASRVAFVESSAAKAPEVHAGALGSTPPPAVTAINAALAPGWGTQRSVEWVNEGRHMQGWLTYPAHYDSHRHYPMVVIVHGGPSSTVLPSWPGTGFGPAPLAALGYFVLQPNPRGSYGEGEAFVQANRRDFGYGDLRDILAGVDAVEKLAPVDDERLGITGWSYGGFMTMFAVTQTHRFHAAVAGAGIADWQSYYGENLIDQWMIPFFGASVYDDPAVYAKSSAIHFIKQVKTPTLVVVGDRDAECPAPQSFEFWHALRALSLPTELVVYPDEGHHFVQPAHQRDVLARMLGWFAHYLPPRD